MPHNNSDARFRHARSDSFRRFKESQNSRSSDGSRGNNSVIEKDQEEPDDHSESLLTRLIIAPVLFISFLISLALVNRRDRAQRVAAHPSADSGSLRERLSPQRWLNPEPYRWSTSESNVNADGQAPDDEREQNWYVKKKHRAVAKFEFTEAFEMRPRVIVSIAVAAGALLIVGGITLRLVYGWVVHPLFQ